MYENAILFPQNEILEDIQIYVDRYLSGNNFSWIIYFYLKSLFVPFHDVSCSIFRFLLKLKTK